MKFNDAMVINESQRREEFRSAIKEYNLIFSEEELFLLEEQFLNEGFGQTAKKWIAGAVLGIALLSGVHAASIPGLEKMDDSTAQKVYDTAIEYTLKGEDISSLKKWVDDRGYDSVKFIEKVNQDVGSNAGKYKTSKDGKDFKVVKGEIVVEAPLAADRM